MTSTVARMASRRVIGQRFSSTVADASKFQSKRLVPNPEKAKAYINTYTETREHAKSTFDLWRKVSIWVCIPALLASAVNTYFIEAEHAKHRAHDAEIPDEERLPEFDYQNIRSKKYFWGDGDKTLFWNPEVNRHITRD